jgi:hypothetical protein
MFKLISCILTLSISITYASEVQKFDTPKHVYEGFEYSLAIADIQDILYGGPEELEMAMTSAHSFCKINGFDSMDDFQGAGGAGEIKSALYLNSIGDVEYIVEDYDLYSMIAFSWITCIKQ